MPAKRRSMRRSRLQRSAQLRLMIVICKDDPFAAAWCSRREDVGAGCSGLCMSGRGVICGLRHFCAILVILRPLSTVNLDLQATPNSHPRPAHPSRLPTCAPLSMKALSGKSFTSIFTYLQRCFHSKSDAVQKAGRACKGPNLRAHVPHLPTNPPTHCTHCRGVLLQRHLTTGKPTHYIQQSDSRSYSDSAATHSMHTLLKASGLCSSASSMFSCTLRCSMASIRRRCDQKGFRRA